MSSESFTDRLTFSFPDLNGDERLRQMILYIAEKCEDDATFGAIKLNKILWAADFQSYARFREPVTGVEYMRLPNGPAPKRMLPVKQKMKEDQVIAERQKQRYGYVQHRVTPLREADLSEFSGRDISVVDDVIREMWGETAKDVSDRSHDLAWKIAANKERIPYQAVFLSDEPLTDYDVQLTAELAAHYGWEAEVS